ncbi:uncharacterized protein LOC131659693 [Vicia villosa]|uniref:uncharacterized protein LOC131659693 n=1 Tax=Vicia villosa TaxID=3911 RepID=UPI00273BB1DC|nr:uncharacterized protein LOC131659693 [Vicia villosa]
MVVLKNLLGVTNKLFMEKSEASEKDILINAHAFYEQDEGAPFNLEYAWRLLKDEPKWMGVFTKNSSKRTKNSASGSYTASPNSETPSSYELNSSSPMERPMGQKAAKRKGKAKENANEPPSSVIFDTRNKRMEVMENLARLKEEENKLVKEKMEFEAMQFIMSDTSKMNDSQREFHEKRCNNLKQKYGCITGSNNGINVPNQSNVFNDILEGRAATVQYTINGTPYNMGYYLADGERHTYGGDFDYSYDNVDDTYSTTETFNGPHPNLATRLQRRATLREKQVHRKLQGDLIKHIWERFGHEDDVN